MGVGCLAFAGWGQISARGGVRRAGLRALGGEGRALGSVGFWWMLLSMFGDSQDKGTGVRPVNQTRACQEKTLWDIDKKGEIKSLGNPAGQGCACPLGREGLISQGTACF